MLSKLLALGLLVGGTTGALAIQSANAATADQTQETSNEQEFRGRGHGPQGAGFMHHGPNFMQNVDRSVEKIENGVVLTLTTDDADTLQKLQDWSTETPDHEPEFMQNVTRTVVQLDNGVQITLTSDDSDTVTKLQEGPLGGGHHEDFMQNVNRTVENTDNGVIITLTSDDPETVKLLQERQ